ncbi:MAG TPA: ABC transporter permease [Chloroflexia bacterium]|jgi:osmoprotectant transport system permease protein
MDQLTRYLFQNFDKVWPRMLEHVTLSATAMLIALVIALPLGLAISKFKPAAPPVLGVLDVIYTIPSFALFAFLVPITGIGTQPALIALSAYALVVLVHNTMVAFNGVDAAVREAARGMGMDPWRVLWRIEVPLALPIIIAGIRIAALSTVGLTTIAAWIGAGGMGQLLRDGMNDPTYSKLYAGIISIGVIAIAADLLFRLLERLVSVPTQQKDNKSLWKDLLVKRA